MGFNKKQIFLKATTSIWIPLIFLQGKVENIARKHKSSFSNSSVSALSNLLAELVLRGKNKTTHTSGGALECQGPYILSAGNLGRGKSKRSKKLERKVWGVQRSSGETPPKAGKDGKPQEGNARGCTGLWGLGTSVPAWQVLSHTPSCALNSFQFTSAPRRKVKNSQLIDHKLFVINLKAKWGWGIPPKLYTQEVRFEVHRIRFLAMQKM